jgi:hypothetical protein
MGFGVKRLKISRIREICAVFRCGALAALVPVMVRVLPLPRVLCMLEPKRKLRESSYNAHELARIAGAVIRRGPRFGVGECLVRSLILYNLLQRFAYAPVLLIGGRLFEGRFDCHCWIEVDGKSVHESNDPRKFFKVFYRQEV